MRAWEHFRWQWCGDWKRKLIMNMMMTTNDYAWLWWWKWWRGLWPSIILFPLISGAELFGVLSDITPTITILHHHHHNSSSSSSSTSRGGVTSEAIENPILINVLLFQVCAGQQIKAFKRPHCHDNEYHHHHQHHRRHHHHILLHHHSAPQPLVLWPLSLRALHTLVVSSARIPLLVIIIASTTPVL